MARAKEFDRSEVLEKALGVFWQKGYEATSLPDLTNAMQISRSSLYECFSDKETLFYEAIRFYAERHGKETLRRLTAAKSAREGISRFLLERGKAQLSFSSKRSGCFMTYAATSLEPSCRRVAAALRTSSVDAENALYDLVRRGQNAGELPRARKAKDIARMILLIAYGIDVISCFRRDDEAFAGAIRTALALLEG